MAKHTVEVFRSSIALDISQGKVMQNVSIKRRSKHFINEKIGTTGTAASTTRGRRGRRDMLPAFFFVRAIYIH
jgi:hypothetical protein